MHNSLLHRDLVTFVDSKAGNLEDAARKGCNGSLSKHLRELMKENPPTGSLVLSDDGSILDDVAGPLSVRSSHFSMLLNAKAVAHPDVKVAIVSKILLKI
ncbi:hypothetical protein QYM36_016943 [Artemia franciscana]|uniref:Uncharacterized protein n=1 Tax=Artemia franciscana TaxID=6661 RepID=A0AA88KWF1_ARTSF|nr:hypothetical protein QYM36_016943 [Artemia franciscana]